MPWPMANDQMTLATPTRMPRIVSRERERSNRRLRAPSSQAQSRKPLMFLVPRRRLATLVAEWRPPTEWRWAFPRGSHQLPAPPGSWTLARCTRGLISTSLLFDRPSRTTRNFSFVEPISASPPSNAEPPFTRRQ